MTREGDVIWEVRTLLMKKIVDLTNLIFANDDMVETKSYGEGNFEKIKKILLVYKDHLNTHKVLLSTTKKSC